MPLHPCTDACRYAQAEQRIAELEACLQEIRSIHIEPSDTAYDAMKKVGDLLDSAQPRFLLAERASKARAEGYAKGREYQTKQGFIPMCNQNCNQGRECDCRQEDPQGTMRGIVIGVLMGSLFWTLAAPVIYIAYVKVFGT